MKKQILLVIAVLFFMNVNTQKSEQLAITPPMGWNSWNKFGCDVSEKLIMDIADLMVANNMVDAGYKYIVIDYC